MMKKAILALGVLASAISANAQTKVCATDEVFREQKARFPGIAEQEARLNEAIQQAMQGRIKSPFAKTSADEDLVWADDTRQFHIPVVVHVIYDYAATDASAPSNNITDAQIEASIAQMDKYYNQEALNLGGVIAPFVPWVGNPRISFHLANKDPFGKPTRGIVRNYSYHANGGDEAAKINPWAPDRYLNVYLIYKIGRGASNGTVLAYATFPASFADNPYSQGVISRVDQATNTISSTLSHEVGHYLSLYHPWNNNNAAVEEGDCGDDEVDDTPPTVGHFSCGPAKLFDTRCAIGYYKDYDSASFHKIMGFDLPVRLAFNDVADAPRLFNDSLKSGVGQSFTTSNRTTFLQEISVYVDALPVKGGNTKMNLYNGAGTTLISRSMNTPAPSSGNKLTYTFTGVRLNPNTTYRFVLDTIGGPTGGHRSFSLKTSTTDKYSGGSMYVDSAARVPLPGADLMFEVLQLRRIDYPDTTNTQNVMDYADCSTQMFTRGQVARMRATLRADVGFRSRLVSDENLLQTGVWDAANNVALPRADIAPTALFSASRYFVCADGASTVQFTDRSYNDTLSSINWTFSNGASTETSNASSLPVAFTTPGWVNVSLTANGTGTGSNTLTTNNLVYAADPNAINPMGYYQEFNPNTDLDKYPLFNYYNLPDNKWELFDGAGLYDKTCVRFRNFDTRTVTIGNAVGSPGGSYSDMFTRAFDLSNYGDLCNLSFFSAGAYRTTLLSRMNDSLEIAVSNNCGENWFPIGTIGGAALGNNGLMETPFVPGWSGNWKEQSIDVPSFYRGDKVYFRFRFRPGTDFPTWTGSARGTGNHFYMDRLSISDAPLGVKGGVIVSLGMNVTPNPTSGAATISLNGGDNSKADITVTDVTGKLVFSSSVNRAATSTKVEIPAAAISVKGMYLVKVVTGGATETQKLIVY